jgi:signal transduction histidine kinase
MKPVDYFIRYDYKADAYLFYRSILLLKACLFTTLFSLLYLLVSLVIEFAPGVYFMSLNIVSFLSILFLLKTRVPLILLGNVYVFIGTLAVVVLTYFSGGVSSPIFPWLIAPSVLALLIVNRFYSFIWAGVSLICLIAFIVMAMWNVTFPVNYNDEWKLPFTLLCSFGLVFIVFLVIMVFERNTLRSFEEVQVQKKEIQQSKEELAIRHTEILEKNEILTGQHEELTVISDQLKELHEKKDYLLEILAHDLKSPLTNIQALAGLIELDKYDDESIEKQVLERIIECSHKSQTLIQRILSSENLESIIYKLKLEIFDVSEILETVITDLQDVASRKNLKIYLNKDSGRNYCAHVDKIYLRQMYENLLNNAIKFSPSGKHIFVSINVSDQTIRTAIRDEGPGIPKAEINLLFKKFKKLSNKPTAGESSTGLGLSIVKHYADLLNGKVWCESTPGEGSNFIVELPIHENSF